VKPTDILQFTTDGNCKAELNLFQQCNSKFIVLLQQCPFLYQDVQVIYKQCYPCYPLPATIMPPDKLYKLQSLATAIFFTKLGYPRTFPQVITHASGDRGSLVSTTWATDKVCKNAYKY